MKEETNKDVLKAMRWQKNKVIADSSGDEDSGSQLPSVRGGHSFEDQIGSMDCFDDTLDINYMDDDSNDVDLGAVNKSVRMPSVFGGNGKASDLQTLKQLSSMKKSVGYEEQSMSSNSKSPSRLSALPRVDFSPPRKDFSSPRMNFSSSRKDFSSPRKDFSSPRTNFSSPRKDFSSPRMNFSSPRKDFSSPRTNYSSPRNNFSSARTGFSSSRKDFSSPRKSFSSTRKDFSSTRMATSSPKNRTEPSPRKAKFSPKKNKSGSFQSLLARMKYTRHVKHLFKGTMYLSDAQKDLQYVPLTEGNKPILCEKGSLEWANKGTTASMVARRLMEGVFTPEALTSCSLTGIPPRGKGRAAYADEVGIKKMIHPDGVDAILKYAMKLQKENNWKPRKDEVYIRQTMGSVLCEKASEKKLNEQAAEAKARSAESRERGSEE